MLNVLYSYRDELPKNLFKITAEEFKKVHFRLTCVAQKRRCPGEQEAALGKRAACSKDKLEFKFF